MGQKTNPVSLRLQNVNRNFDSSWYSDRFYAKSLSRDFYLTNYMNNFLKCLKLPQARIFVNFGIQNIKLYPFFCIPKTSRVSFAKNLGLFQNLSKAWLNNSSISLKKSQIQQLDKNASVLRVESEFASSQKTKQNTINLNDALFFNSYSFSDKNSMNILKLTPKSCSYPTEILQKLSKNKENFNFLENLSLRLLLTNSVTGTLLQESKGFCERYSSVGYNSLNKVKTINGEKNKTNLKNHLKELLLDSYNSNDSIMDSSFLDSLRLLKGNERVTPISFQSSKTLEEKSDSLEFCFSTEIVKMQESKKTYSLSVPFSRQELLSMPNKDQIIDSFYLRKTKSNLISSRELNFYPTRKLDKYPTGNATMSISSLKGTQNEIKGIKDQQKDFSFMTELNSKLSLVMKNAKSDLYKNDFKYKSHIENFLSSQYNLDLQLIPFLSKHNWQSAGFVADEIVYFLERRISFSRIKNRILKQASLQPYIRGLRISCSGRVGGKSKKAQRATQEIVKYGETSLHVFDCKIDFATRSAYTSFGTVGVKVWICYHQISK